MKLWITFLKMIGVLILVVWLGRWALFLHYDFTRPTVRQPTEGRLYPSFNHGHTVFLTQQELRYLNILDLTTLGLIVIGASMGFGTKWRLRQKSTGE